MVLQRRRPAVGLTPFLSPTYIRKVPAREGWNETIDYWDNAWDETGGGNSTTGSGDGYTLISYAKDGHAGSVTWLGGGPKTDFNADILYSKGVFLQWLEGMQVD
jgi:hypothetical protein